MATQPDTIIYPAEDGSVTESDAHFIQGAELVLALKRFFAGRPDVFVAGNMAVYYVRGNPHKYFGPDVLVAFGAPSLPEGTRQSYLLWEEGVPPAVVIELTSASTRREDTVQKPREYAALGVREYYLFDPRGEFLTPRLQGYHLAANHRYMRLAGDELDSPALGLRLVVREGKLRLFNPATDTLLPTLNDQEATLVAQEAEIARLRAELAQLQGR
jgi:Uma2 family endonuclease